MRESDADLAAELFEGHRRVVSGEGVERFVAACDRALAPLGGRLTEGYSTR